MSEDLIPTLPPAYDAAQGAAAVLVTSPPTAEPQKLRDALVDALGMHKLDAMQQARRCGVPGVLAEDVGPRRARALEQALAKRGIDGLVVASERLPDPPPQLVRWIDAGGDQLLVSESDGAAAVAFAWGQVLVMSAGLIKQPSTVAEIGGGGATGSMGDARMTSANRHAKVRREQEPQKEMWVYTGLPVQLWRILPGEVSYEYLGDRQQPKARHNFPLLMGDLGPRVASQTPAARSLIADDKLGTHVFATHDDFVRYNRAHLVVNLIERGAL